MIKKKNISLETNSVAMARWYKEVLYPSDEILAKCKKAEIPFVISADAHEPDKIDYEFESMRNKLKKAGYSKTSHLKKNKWIEVDL